MLASLLSVPLYITAAYFLGLVVIIPGLMVSQMAADSRMPNWQRHLAILAFGGLGGAALVLARGISLG